MAAQSGMDQNFHHPYQPYDIQKQFMTALYQCIEDGKIGIFESPTGESDVTGSPGSITTNGC
jgi:Rad3-related DNA helicase